MKYRAEIDGLRALAVVPVILFHAGFELFSGGYVGVDVFFVISGYLITTILIEDIENNRFSILKFYERRARRILPALILVMLVFVPAAWIWMFPIQMKGYSESLLATLSFVSNFYFTFQGGYFGTSTKEMPLLHTWSLAVEEQYYLLFPLFLIFVWKFGRNRVLWTIILFAVLSLVASEIVTKLTQGRANFYFTPTRAWELLAGSITAFIIHKNNVQTNNIFALLGLIAVAFAVFIYNESTPFPSLYTLVPVIGTVLLILFAGKKTWVAKFLSTKLFVGLGLISYSAYLWHQPLFALAQIRLIERPSSLLMGCLAMLSIMFAYFSWRFVEKPYRSPNIIGRRKFFVTLSLASVIVFVIGILGHKSEGYRELMLTYKYPPSEVSRYRAVFESTSYDMYEFMAKDECHIWIRDTQDLDYVDFNRCSEKYGKAVVILGDSHAMNLYNIFSKSKAFPFILSVAQGSCRPHGTRKSCHYQSFEHFVLSNVNAINNIIYHQSGSYFIMDSQGNVDSQQAFEGDFAQFSEKNILKTLNYIERVQSETSIKVTFIGPFLEYRRSPLSVIDSEELNFVNPESIRLFNKLEPTILEIMKKSKKVNYIRFSDLFFEPTESFVENCFMFRDNDHFSLCGEKIIAEKSRFDWLIRQ